MDKSIALVFSVIMIFTACQQDRSGWKGTIQVVDGVQTVKNPQEPIYSGEVLELEEDLSIGASKGGDEYIFSRIGNLDVDKNGNIYAIDTSSAHIRVFDSNGQYLRAIGRKGQGPGEMQMPLFVQITSQDEIAVYDYLTQRLVLFSLEGKYLRQVSAARMRYPVLPLRLDSHGNIVGIQIMAPPPVGGKDIGKYDPNFEPLFMIAQEEQNKNYKRGEFDIAMPTLLCAVSPNGNIAWGNSSVYELHILNPEGKRIRKIQKAHSPLALTAKEKERYEKEYSEVLASGGKLNFPDRFPAFMDISVDEKDWLWVKTYERVDGEENSYYFDIFDSEGKYMAKVPIRVNLDQSAVWKENMLYTIETGKEGFQMIKRFRVQWKIQGIAS
jgi:uncharacterized protein YuzE